MCRNIRQLFNFEPVVTEEEIQAAALQYVRKISGFTKPSRANEEAFQAAVVAITEASRTMLGSLETQAAPRNRQTERTKARARHARRVAREKALS